MGVFSAGLCWKSLNFRNSKTSSKIHCHDTKMIPVVVGEFEGSMIYHFRMNDVARPWVCSQELLQNEKVDIINDAWPSKLATDFHMMIHDMDDESMTDLSVHIYIYIYRWEYCSWILREYKYSLHHGAKLSVELMTAPNTLSTETSNNCIKKPSSQKTATKTNMDDFLFKGVRKSG